MATKTYYLTNTLSGSWQTMDETSPGADAYASPVTGWVASTGSTNRSEFAAATERAATTFDATTYPDGTLNTTIFDAWRSTNALNGSFASANWTINGVVRANTNGGAQDGRLYYRLIKADADGANAAEITSAAQQGALLTNVSTSADFDSSLTWNPGAFTITNQYLFIQVAWERTGAGGMTNSDINFRIGTNSTRVLTSDFTPSSTNYTADVSETVSLSEAIGALYGAVAAPGETVSLSESTAAAYAAIANISENPALSEFAGAAYVAIADVSETASLGEQLAAGLLLTSDVSETVTLSESTGTTYGAVANPSETVASSESVGAAYAALAALNDTVTVLEALAAGLLLTVDVAEAAPLSESLASSYGAVAALGEVASLSDALGAQWGTSASIAEAVALAEAIVADIVSNASVSGAAGVELTHENCAGYITHSKTGVTQAGE